MADNRPYVSAAFVCERILESKDGVLSAIRIVDTLYVSLPENLPSNVVPQIEATIFLAFQRSAPGSVEGHQVEVQLNPPSGVPGPKQALQLSIPEGDVGGANVILNIVVPAMQFGRFVLDVWVDGEIVTRVPFRLLQKAKESPTVLH